jgi:geranylgeranyl transferase type-2 subunit alpha
VARQVWEAELGLASKMLGKDRRNFHAWGYRRHVVAQLESVALRGASMVEAEFEYTYRMIQTDLSNFSAWHSRSKLIPRLLDERGADDAARRAFLDKGAPTHAHLLFFPSSPIVVVSLGKQKQEND